jgi:uncharacterized protein (TIGR02453 family)
MMFAGFPLGAQQFLAELAENNDRAWFAENRERYESDLLDPEKDFVDAVGGKFAQLDQRVQAVPAVNRSIFRINRDVRFTPDKSPYKTHSDLWFWVGDDRKFASGYFVRILPDAVWIGGGQYQMGPDQLRRYRTAVTDGVRGRWLESVLGDLAAAGYEMGEPSLKRVPKGFSAQQGRADLLRFTEIHVITKVSPPPAEMQSAAFVEWCMERFSVVKPLVDWLTEELAGLYPPDMRL